MKKDKILFWTTTIIIFIMEGIIPALTSQTELAKQGISHMQYPAYFGNALVVFKVIGALTVIIPQAPKFAKEWAYTGFGFVFIFASISHYAVGGFGFQAILPLIFLGILVISYRLYHKLYQKEYAVSAAY
ncbi:DoxX family protein [Flavobacterium sp.]|uniref:DoxX family protein n=1 Tax=Flavobacterium sp. TaxID=239 RepID=UPI0025BBD853|nr:DoxX family protein [Flavobacterium sp.]